MSNELSNELSDQEQQSMRDLMRVMVDSYGKKAWPRCRACEAQLMLCTSGFICPCGNSPIIPVSRTSMSSPQVTIGTLRLLFPERCMT